VDDARELARWARLVTANRLINLDPMTWTNTGQGGNTHGGAEFCTPATQLAEAFVVLTFPDTRSGAVPLFVELCAGLASVSLVLQGGPRARPPVSRMGNKRGYSEAILWACGLRQGQGARAFLWCEPDPGCRALLTAYGQPEVLRQAAAIIRGWADEEPRELWERLKAEGPIKGVEAGEVARFSFMLTNTHSSSPGLDSFKVRTASTERRQTARFLPEETRTEIGRYIRERREVAGLSRRQVDDALGLSTACSWWEGRPKGTRPPSWPIYQRLKPLLGLDGRYDEALSSVTTKATPIENPKNWAVPVPEAPEIADRLGRTATFPAITVSPDAREIDPPALPAGSVCYIDPPYVNTTGYGHDLPRAEVVAMARRWRDAGALVAVSEQEALPELMAEGWHAVDITSTRRGQKRTFSKQQREFLTMSEPPRWTPAEQLGLFA